MCVKSYMYVCEGKFGKFPFLKFTSTHGEIVRILSGNTIGEIFSQKINSELFCQFKKYSANKKLEKILLDMN